MKSVFVRLFIGTALTASVFGASKYAHTYTKSCVVSGITQEGEYSSLHPNRDKGKDLYIVTDNVTGELYSFASSESYTKGEQVIVKFDDSCTPFDIEDDSILSIKRK